MSEHPCPICDDPSCVSWNYQLSRATIRDDDRTYQVGKVRLASLDKVQQCALRLACGISNARGRDISQLVTDEEWLSPTGRFPDWALPTIYKELEHDPVSFCHVVLQSIGEEVESSPRASLPTPVPCPICDTINCRMWADGIQARPFFRTMHKQMREQFLAESPETQEAMRGDCQLIETLRSAAQLAQLQTISVSLGDIVTDPAGIADRIVDLIRQMVTEEPKPEPFEPRIIQKPIVLD